MTDEGQIDSSYIEVPNSSGDLLENSQNSSHSPNEDENEFNGVDERIYDDDFIQISQTCTKISKKYKTRDSRLEDKESHIDGNMPCVCCAHEKSSVCSICLERFSVVGEHRLSSLRCGHLFGYQCIYNWIKSTGSNAKCPLCNEVCSVKHIRLIYATLVLAEDNTLSNSLKVQLKKAIQDKNYFESQYVQNKFKIKLKDREIEQLKENNKDLNNIINFSKEIKIHDKVSSSKSYKLFKSQVIASNGGCRFLRKSKSQLSVITVIPSISPLVPGFGLRILSMLELKPIQYIPLHIKQVKSLSVMSDYLLLSTSLDRTWKLIDIRTAQPSIDHMMVDIPFSSAVNHDNNNIFYCGTNKGTIHSFDIRNTSLEISRTSTELNDKNLPIFGLEYSCQDQQRPPGIFSNHCNTMKFNFCSNDIATNNAKLLPKNGSISAINFHSSTQHLLVSKRPTKFEKNITHEVQQVEIIDKQEHHDEKDLQINVHIIHRFKGGSMSTYMNQSYIMKNSINNELSVFAGDEQSRSVLIWNITNGKLDQKIYSRENVLDISEFDETLCFQSDKSIMFFKV